MTSIEAYILAKKIALGAVSGIKNLTFNGDKIIFHFNDGSTSTMTIPLPKDGKDGQDGKDGRDGIDGQNGKDGRDGIDGQNGKDGQDGISIVDVKINENNHIICTLSDDSTIDAGQIPSSKGGGLVQVKDESSLPETGDDTTLYLTQDEETLYYWNSDEKLYKTISSSSDNVTSIDFKTSSDIEFDGQETTFDLPISNKTISVFVNGVYLTEEEDYTIDRTVSPNQITFFETWDDTDFCTIVWVKGNIVSEGKPEEIDLSNYYTKQEVDKLITEIESTSDPLPSGGTKGQVLVKLSDNEGDIGWANIAIEGGGTTPNISLATREDIDELFDEGGNTNGN